MAPFYVSFKRGSSSIASQVAKAKRAVYGLGCKIDSRHGHGTTRERIYMFFLSGNAPKARAAIRKAFAKKKRTAHR